jgi:hypothetical protein
MDSLIPFSLIFLVTVFFIYYRLSRGNSVEDVALLDLHPHIDIALSLADENPSEEGMQHASAEILDQLKSKGIVLDRPLTSDEATHLLELFSPPSGRQIDILKHFRLPHSLGMSKTMANYHIREIFKDPANIERWNRRPPTSRIQQALLFMSGQMISGLTYVEAQSKLTELGMQKPMKYQAWKRMERLYFESNSPELLKKYNARKITWKHFFKIHDALTASGCSEDEIDGASILERLRSERGSSSAELVSKMNPVDMSPA